MFKTNNKGFGFGAMPGFNKRKVSSISNGDFDRDGVKNRKDCDAFNFRKQGPEHEVKIDENGKRWTKKKFMKERTQHWIEAFSESPEKLSKEADRRLAIKQTETEWSEM